MPPTTYRHATSLLLPPMKTAALFAATFALGALLALVARTALHDPHAGPTDPAPAHAGHASHAGHAAPAPAAPAPAAAGAAGAAAATTAIPVNTVCSICGMAVDPKLPTAEYQGKTIGFGCRMCPPKFRAEPDRYGPLYLRNEVIAR